MKHILGVLTILMVALPSFAADSQDYDHHRPFPGHGEMGCPNQRFIEFKSRHLIDEANRFSDDVQRSRGYETLGRDVERLIHHTWRFQGEAERARNCYEIRFAFEEVDRVARELNRHYNELRREESRHDLFIDSEYRRLEEVYFDLQRTVVQPEFPGNPGDPDGHDGHGDHGGHGDHDGHPGPGNPGHHP